MERTTQPQHEEPDSMMVVGEESNIGRLNLQIDHFLLLARDFLDTQ
jgi:hypothetical protein